MIEQLYEIEEQVDKQIEQITNDTRALWIRFHESDEDFNPYAMQYPDGRYMLTDLLVAKANILAARVAMRVAG